MILAHDALIQLTGLRRPSAVRRWLERERIPYVVGADGWPRVLQALIIERLGGHAAPPVAEPRLRLRNG
ncbi:DUF4224 domain-containing protein [Rhodocyclus tenuis]|uniref:DUF4224 domain-containing protein n=1 Tax=Rhodocyclus tenuis TaxID=1066 RepID=A0A840GD10_RHOTE|nr:DUF4224 domain-containing protein [Rhodocyclus tenuis]MBB4248518.1 hypothetical protein [Rhodocyclus tenuis]